MSVIMIVIFIVFLNNMQIAEPDAYWTDYCMPKRTNAMKGIFVMIVFVSHIQGYITLGDQDALAVMATSFLGQLMVAPFLFYSGYGVMESIRKKGLDYVKKIPVQRAVKTWLHFAVALTLFLIQNIVLNIPVDGKTICLALLIWESVGHSTWYIFTMIFLYLFTAVSFYCCREKHCLGAVFVTVLTVAYSLVLAPFKEEFWYNTSLCYVMGIWYSLLRPHIEKIVLRSDLMYCVSLLVSFYVYRQAMRFAGYSVWMYQLYAIGFMILLVGVSMKLRLDNPLLQFLGKHTFSIYILQRIPMRYFEISGLFEKDHVTVFVLCFLMTCGMAIVFDTVTGYLDRRVFGK